MTDLRFATFNRSIHDVKATEMGKRLLNLFVYMQIAIPKFRSQLTGCSIRCRYGTFQGRSQLRWSGDNPLPYQQNGHGVGSGGMLLLVLFCFCFSMKFRVAKLL